MRNNPLLRHQLATLSYRTDKAVMDAGPDFGGFHVGSGVRTPHELVNHMANLMWLTAEVLRGKAAEPLRECPTFEEEVERFQSCVHGLSVLLGELALEREGTAERLLQGPLSDAMTHAGQLALLRRLGGSPIPAEDFFRAPIGGLG